MKKNKDILELYENLSSLKGLEGVSFNYAVVKNLNKLKPEVEAIVKAQENSPEYQKFEDERIELCKKHAKKDENGEPKMKDKAFDIEDMPAFKKELETLKEKHVDAITGKEKQLKDLEKLLEEESKIELHTIKLDDVPKDIKTEQMLAIYGILE